MTEKRLLEDIRHELVCISGLTAFDSKSERVVLSGVKKRKAMDKYGFDYDIIDKKYTVPFNEVIDLNFSDLIERIEKELRE